MASSLLLAVALPATESFAAPKKTSAVKASAVKASAVKTGAVKASATKTTSAAKSSAAKTSTAKSSAAKTSTAKTSTAKTTTTGTIAATGGATGTVQGELVATRASRLDAVLKAKTINYYPSNAGWSAMWTAFDAAKIDADLAKAAALGADNVRVVVFPQAFGFPQPKPEYAERLRKFISIADSHGMTVKLTLFDWWAGYGDATGSAAWAKALLIPYANDSRVLSVELKNEIPPNDTAAIAWVKKLIPAVRAAVPAMPLTLSTDGQSGAAGLAKIKSQLTSAPLDYYDFHFYGSSERALTEIRKAQSAVAPTPIVIGETGLSTASGNDGEQSAFLARVFEAARIAGVHSVAPWTLTDFAAGAIPSNSQVSKVAAQYRFGLHRVDGTAKVGASVVRTAWTGGKLSNSILDLGFEASAGDSPWRPYLAEQGAAVRDRSTARSGKSSVRFSDTGRTSSGVPSVRISPVTPVQAGKSWHAEAWARGTGVTGTNEIALSWFDANDKWLGQHSSKQVAKGTSGWTKLTVDAVAPAGAASVQLHLKSGDNNGTVWFDDVTLS